MYTQINLSPEGSEPWGVLFVIVPILGALVLIIALVKFLRARGRRVTKIYEAAARQNLLPITVKGLWPDAYATQNGSTKLLLMGDHLHVERLWKQPDMMAHESLARPKNV
jgi:hypothetical protein